MQSTFTQKRSRASSDPGISLTAREDLKLRPMGIQAEASARLSVKERAAWERAKNRSSNDLAAPNSPVNDGTPSPESLQTATTPDPGARRTITITTMPEHEILVGPTIGTPTSARPSGEEEATAPGQEENSARATPGRQPTDSSPQSHSPILPLADRERRFFEKYRTLVEPSEFEEFRSILGRKRTFRQGFYENLSGNKDNLFTSRNLAHRIDRSSESGFLVIEDVDIGCILALDAKFNLDPEFVLHYVGFRGAGGQQRDCYSGDKTHFADNGMAGSWCVASGHISGSFKWQMHKPPLTARQTTFKFWNRNKRRPWWQEACRQSGVQPYTQYRSKIAWYCLSNEFRLFLVESTPKLSARVEQPFNLRMRIGQSLPGTPTVLLPVSLKHLVEGRPFALFDCLVPLLCSLAPRGRPMDFRALNETELHAVGDLALFSESQSSSKTLLKAVFSTWTLAAFQWRANLSYLQDTFRRRRFDAVARPGMLTYLPLIQLRHLIVSMRDHLPDAQGKSELLFITPFQELFAPTTLGDTLSQIAADVDKLEKALNDEIHLIIGAVTVQDSDANKQQSERATLLTLLAAVYLPLTLVTGIFGMNIKDINDTSPSWRACGLVLAVVAAGTIVFVVAYWRWRVWRKKKLERERMGLGFLKDV